MLTVVCVYWKGKFRRRELSYSEEWVIKLRNMVKRNLSVEHRFVCLSNVPIEGVETIPLLWDWPGWWSKIELFRPGLFEGRVLYLDLDTVVMKNMDELVEQPESFGIIRVQPVKKVSEKGKQLIVLYNSSVMVFDAGKGDLLYSNFIKRPDYWMDQFRGDQDYIGYTLPHLEALPSKWIKKFRFLKDKNAPPDKDVIILLGMSGREGKTAKLAKKYKWLNEYWR